MSIFPEGGVHIDRVPAKSGVGHIAHLAGAMVLPVYLDGTRSLYTPWRCPKVRVVVGAPLHVEGTRSPRANSPGRRRSASSTRSTTSLNRGPAQSRRSRQTDEAQPGVVELGACPCAATAAPGDRRLPVWPTSDPLSGGGQSEDTGRPARSPKSWRAPVPQCQRATPDPC